MRKQVFNPYLPCWEYVPDGEPHVFGDRLYVFGSHDKFSGDVFCQNDYVCWSAPVKDLSDWRYEGIIYRKIQDPRNPKGEHCLYAPDVAEYKGKYYLFYCLDTLPEIGVAVCDTPCGEYEFLGFVHHADGRLLGSDNDNIQFDPSVLVDGESIYLYSGYSPVPMRPRYGSQVTELLSDMLTLRAEPKKFLPPTEDSKGTGFEGHEFYEASSMRKIGGKYYFVYSSVRSHELCYAVSDYPDHGFSYGGTIVDIGDVGLNGREESMPLNALGNTHGGLVRLNESWFIFYHRQTNQTQFSRQGCAERVEIKNGKISQVEITSCGLNEKPLVAEGTYPAYIACTLLGTQGCNFYSFGKASLDRMQDNEYFDDVQKVIETTEGIPYLTQDEEDGQSGKQYVTNIKSGAVVGYKYFALNGDCCLSVRTRGEGIGDLLIYTELGREPIAKINIISSKDWVWQNGVLVDFPIGKSALFFAFNGHGSIDFLEFQFKN